MNALPNNLSRTIRIDVLPNQGEPVRRKPDSKTVGEDPSRPPSRVVSPIRSEEYQSFFETAYDATLITDLNGAYVNANRRVTELLGYDQHGLSRLCFWQLVSGADAQLMETVRQSLASERFLRISAWCLRRDGTSFAAEIAVNRLVSGERDYLCFSIRDETVRAQAEAQLRTVQYAVQNASTGIGVVGLSGNMLYANPSLAALLGANDPKLIRGRPLTELLGDAQVVQALFDTVRKGENALAEVALPQLGESPRWGQVAAAPNLNSEDVLIGMVLSLVDISDRRRAEQAERALERDKVMMESLGAVCHHLGQPATVLLTTIEMMSRMPDSEHNARHELLQICLEAAETLRKTLIELNEIRHYATEPYPGPSASQASSILALASNNP